MLYDAILFDLDGTLTDSQPGIFACAKYAMEKMQVPIPDDITMRRFVGPPLADSFMRLCGMNEEDALRATAFYRERYIPIGWKENRVYPRIRALLHHLKQQGVYLAVATGKPQNTSIEILKYFGLYDYFDAVAGPAPGEFHANKADLIGRVLPEGKKAVMVGDHPGDIQGARDQGIASIAVLYGYGENEELLAKQPTHICETTDDLCHLLCPDMPAAKGYFVTMEGVDGCGKTTQAIALQNLLTQFGYTVIRTREPGGCPIAEEIRKIVLAKEDGGMCAETEALLFAASRAQHVKEVILPAVEQGKIVLCDRFVDSSIVYQGGARGLSREWIKEINRLALEKGAPDVTLYLRMDHETALSRRLAESDPDRIEQMGDSFQARTQAAYEQLLLENPGRFLSINGAQEKEAVTEEAFNALFARMTEGGIL